MSALQTSEEKYYNYGTNSYCDYVILPNSVELPMLETANIQQGHRKICEACAIRCDSQLQVSCEQENC